MYNKKLSLIGMLIMLVTAGCMGGGGGGDDPNPEEIVSGMGESSNIDTFQGERVTTIRESGSETTLRLDVKEIKNKGKKLTVTNQDGGPRNIEGKIVVVSPNDSFVAYYPNQNRLDQRLGLLSLQQSSIGSSDFSAYNLSYEGSETVAGRPTHIISLSSETFTNYTLYIDQEYDKLLKYDQMRRGDVVRTSSYENVEYNSDMSNESVSLDVLDEVPLQPDTTGEADYYDSLSGLQSDVSHPIPELNLPDKYTPASIRKLEFEGDMQYRMLYVSEYGSTVSYRVSNRAQNPENSNAETIDENGVSIYIDRNRARWKVGEMVYQIDGPNRQTAVDAATHAVNSIN